VVAGNTYTISRTGQPGQRNNNRLVVNVRKRIFMADNISDTPSVCTAFYTKQSMHRYLTFHLKFFQFFSGVGGGGCLIREGSHS
jgi:hypothetical protein